MVISSFRRSFSFPGSPRAKCRQPLPKGCHARSISLPSSRRHPVLSDLRQAMDSLASWQLQFNRSSAWLCAGLAQLELMHDSLDDLLHLPNSRDSLTRLPSAGAAEKLLEHLLRLADAFGTFRSLLVSMKQHSSEAQAALRRGDAAREASCKRSIKKIQKELAKIASALQKPAFPSRESDIVGEVTQVMRVSVSASTSVFIGLAVFSSSSSKSSISASRSSCLIPIFKLEKKEEEWRQMSALEELQGLKECVVALESRTERVLRRLVNTRVSLLNSMTPAL